MATRVFADEELERLRGFPEISREELFRFFTLSPADVAFVDPGRGRGPADRLGVAIALCTLPWLGFVPDKVTAAPPVAVARLAEQLKVDAAHLRSYGRRVQTRTEHLRLVARYLGWRPAGAMEFKELDEFLLARALEHDSPTLLFRLGCEYLISARVIRPGPETLVRRVAHAREQAQRETYDRLAHEFTPARCAQLDALLVSDPSLRGVSRLRWLSTGPVEASAQAVKAEVDKLGFLRGLGADRLDVSVLPAERRRFLATMGRRLTPQALERRDPQRRYPILLTVLAQSATDVLDEVVALFDQAISAKFGQAERRMQQQLAERGKSGEDRQALLDDLLAIVTDPQIADEEIGGLIRGEKIGWDRLRAAIAQAQPRLPRDHGHLAALDLSYNYLRQFTPAVLSAVPFAGGTAATELLIAVAMLRELNATGRRKVFDEAPTGFVPTKWRGYLDQARKSGSVTAYRHYWELCVLLGLRDGLRSGDVFVPGSRRYADPAAYLLTAEQWAPQRAEFCRLVGKHGDPGQGLAAVVDELHAAVGELETVLSQGEGPVRVDETGDLVISPLSAEDVPAEAISLKAELTEMLPFAPIVSLLIELDKRTGYLDCFTHATGKQSRTPELKRNLIAVLLAYSTNLGLTRMAEACGISYDILSWTAEWYVREETLRAANLTLIDYHQRLPLTAVFGAGTLSSSDGQRFPTRGKSTTARALSRYFANEGVSTYTHVTDQHATYGTKIIVATKREAHYVLDEILGNATDLPITEHATDTHGVTLVNFGLFDLLGMQLSPRIRDLGKITLYRPGPRRDTEARFPHAGPLMTRKANLELIAEHWDDLLRLAGSLKFGHATASLLVGKLSASGRQNTLAAALKEYGALRRTVYAAKYLSDPDYRRKIARQLNKGESLHALRRGLLYAHEGMIRARQLEDQTEQAWCLTLATNAVIAWTTEYYGLAVEQMRRSGRRIDNDVLAHISPAHSENINFFGAIEVDIDAELAALGPTGYRPLRVRDTLF
ncbi:Tn3 family transposase [Nocardia farcinica]|uniref:Tn3 family transposase n=1 Tax=Nocardia farcinica TaxID=37329 RepID=UPI000A36017B|nr:Tn3 family transposase [Nocardia farcinica]MBA4854343.1 Tn3 family transposase [Nocardia farcinica]MBC9814528.1 Tn3 family transposase [Nocardia farcinica]SUE28451.1 transposase [Nocardia farcinica]